MKNFFTIILVAAVLMGFLAAPATAYPDKPVSFVVPWPPGDTEDILTRMIADEFQSRYGVPAAVINKPGGGGGPFPGAMEVARAPADGSMIGSFVIAVPVIGPLVGIEGLTDETFVPIGIFFNYAHVIATRADAPYDTLDELTEYAKSNKVAFGHYGVNLPITKVALAVAKKMGFSFGSDGVFDMLDCNSLASGDVDVITTSIQILLPCLDKVNVLASMTGKRLSKLPHVPTVSEIHPDLGLTLWNGLFVKKGTPQEVIDKVAEVAKDVIFGEKAQKLGENTLTELFWMGPEEARKRILSDRETFLRINEILKEE